MAQSKWKSFEEAAVGVLIGTTYGMACNYWVLPLWGYTVSGKQALEISVVFTVLSFIRGYLVRRWYNSKEDRDALS